MIKRFLCALMVAALALSPLSVFAQSSATPVVPGSLSQTGCPTGVTTCFAPVLTAIAGTQTNVSMASATALTVPANAQLAVITVVGTNNTSGICAYWRDDGTSPTGTTGQPLASLTGVTYFVKNLPIKLIQATGASCTFSVAYYG